MSESMHADKPDEPAAVRLVNHQYLSGGPSNLRSLLELPADDLELLDIARVNLLCAQGLPGADGIDIKAVQAQLDEWALLVEQETERHLYRLFHPDYRHRWNNSEARFRTEMLLQVLQEDCQVKYNEERRFDVDFTRSQDLFIHGLVPDHNDQINGGTCASMPVIYAAVGRRLDYPINLSTTSGHVFCRWDGLDRENPAWRERFNFDGSGEGFGFFDDDHYRTWPRAITEHDIRENAYLQSLDARGEIALFLASRGHCLQDTGRLQEGAIAYRAARNYHPQCGLYTTFFSQLTLRMYGEPQGQQYHFATDQYPGESIIAQQDADRRRRGNDQTRRHSQNPTLHELEQDLLRRRR
ncbi:MAG: hypothetical protein AAGC72_16785 [Planctomycetota bacterium]